MKTLLLSSAIVLSGAAFSQSTFQWDTNDTIETNLNLNTYDQYPMYQSVVGNDTVTLAIEIIYNDLPQSWDGMVCVYGLCLGSIPPVGTTTQMNPIYGSNQGMVRLTVNPFNGTESAKLQILVWDVNYPNDTDTATFLLNTTASTPELLASKVTIAPNPAQDFITVDSDYDLNQAVFIDAAGRVVETIEIVASQQALSVANLPKGVYTVQLSGGQGIIEKRFVKL
ncbi:MAG: T9SS type A sorting domain-containing protein [bacterium]|nr:T9SS type A sorting domain-containing protein [bacterium]